MTDATHTRRDTAQEQDGARLQAVAAAALEGAAADRQRAIASGAIDASDAMTAAGRSLMESNRREASQMADAAARWLRQRADDLTHSRPRDLMDQVDRAARDHPGLFLGAAFALGAVAAAGLQNQGVRDRAARAVEEAALGADAAEGSAAQPGSMSDA